jgi:formylglycine-generating enzyme required for sulfatase activity
MENIKYKKFLIFAIVTLGGCQQISDRLTADVKNLFSLFKQVPLNQNIQTTKNPVLSVSAVTPNNNKELVSDPLQSSLPTDSLKDCLSCPEMVLLPEGKVLIGSPLGEKDRESDESPLQSFSVNKFFLGKYEVTRAQWKYFLQNTIINRMIIRKTSTNFSYYNRISNFCINIKFIKNIFSWKILIFFIKPT